MRRPPAGRCGSARFHHWVDQQGAAVFLQLHDSARPVHLGQPCTRLRIADLGHRQRQPTIVAQARFGHAAAVRGNAQQREFFGSADLTHGAQQAQVEQIGIADGGQVHHPFQQRCIGHGRAPREQAHVRSAEHGTQAHNLGLERTGFTATTGNQDAESSASPSRT